MFVCETLGVWGIMVNHKRSLTRHPSSQDWAPRCPSHLCLCVCIVWMLCFVSRFSFFSLFVTNLACVLYKQIVMYVGKYGITTQNNEQMDDHVTH